jgi:hypothetical protein
MASNTETAKVDVIINGQKANATLQDMRSTARQLNAELAKIPDPFNSPEFKRGQKALDDLKDKMNDLQGKVKQTGSVWQEMLGVFGGISMADIVSKGIGLIKTGFSDMINSTKATGDKWNEMVTGMKFGYDEFMKSIATGSFENFFTNIGKAITAGEEFAKTMDNLKMRQGAQEILSAEAKEKYTELWNIFNNQTLAINARIKAGKEAIAIETEALSGRIVNDKIALDADAKVLESKTKLGAATIEQYIRNYQQNQALIDQAKAYLALEEDLREEYGKDSPDANKIASLKAQIAATPQIVQTYSTVVAGMEKLNDTEYKDFVNIWVNKINTVTEFNQEIKRLNMQLTGAEETQRKQDLNTAEKQIKEHQKNLLQTKKDLEDATIQIIKDEQEKELKLNELDFNRKMAKITGNSQIENDLRAAYIEGANVKADEINKKYSDKAIADAWAKEKAKWDAIIQADDKYSAEWYLDMKAWLDKQAEYELSKTNLTEQEKLDIRAKYKALTDKLEKDLGKPGEDKTSPGDKKINEPGSAFKNAVSILGEDANYKEKKAALIRERDEEIAIAKDNVAEQTKIWKAYYKALEELNIAHIQNLAKKAQSIVNVLSEALSVWSDYQNAIIQKDEEANNEQKDNLQKRLNAGQITQKQYDDKTAKLDEDLNKKKRKAAHDTAVVNRDIAIANAIINTAVAATSALTAGPIIGEVLMALVILLGAIEIALIAATPIPAAAKGRYNVISQGDGKGYNDIPYTGAAKTGIYPRPALISEQGPELIVDAPTTKNIQMNYPWLMQAIQYARIPQYATGKYPVAPPGSQNSAPIIIQDPELKSAIIEFNANCKRGIRTYMVYSDFTEAKDKVDAIKTDVS